MEILGVYQKGIYLHMRYRIPEVGRLVEYYSIFEEERVSGIVINVPTDEEINKIWNCVSPESTRSPDIYFEVLTARGEIERWGEMEWNYIDSEDDTQAKQL